MFNIKLKLSEVNVIYQATFKLKSEITGLIKLLITLYEIYKFWVLGDMLDLYFFQYS